MFLNSLSITLILCCLCGVSISKYVDSNHTYGIDIWWRLETLVTRSGGRGGIGGGGRERRIIEAPLLGAPEEAFRNNIEKYAYQKEKEKEK